MIAVVLTLAFAAIAAAARIRGAILEWQHGPERAHRAWRIACTFAVAGFLAGLFIDTPPMP